MIKLRSAVAERLNRLQEVKSPVYPIGEMLEKLMSLDDARWGMYAFSRDPVEGKFSTGEKRVYAQKANACGHEEAVCLKSNGGGYTPEDIAGKLGAAIVEKNAPAGGGHVIFAQYEETGTVILFKDCLDQLDRIRQGYPDVPFPNREEVRSILLYHELFHHIEHKKKNSIYTQTEKVELWKKPFSNRSRILALSEIAAMAFAREMAGAGYSPFILDVLLVYAYNREAASALYEEILDMEER